MNQFHVVDLADYIEQVRKLDERHTLGITDPKTFVIAVIETEVDQRMRWIAHPTDHLSRLAPYRDLTEEEIAKLPTRLHKLVDHLANLIDNILPERTWVMWYTRLLGQDLILEMGTDYRIVDWERRMESGEWK